MHDRLCEHTVDSFPKKLFVLSSDGSRELPSFDASIFLMLDDNVQQRLSAPNLPDHFLKLKNWLESYKGRFYLANTTTAIEHAHSAHNALDDFSAYLSDINKQIHGLGLGETEIIYTGQGSHPDPVVLETSRALVALAEIAWAWEALSKNLIKEELAFSTSIAFFRWRCELLPHAEVTASTTLVWAALTGNSSAKKCLKLGEKGDLGKLLRNAAFDSVHLNAYLNNSAISRSFAPARLTVFVTGDKALANFIREQKQSPDANLFSTGINFDRPWLTDAKEHYVASQAFKFCVDSSKMMSPLESAQIAVHALQSLCLGELPIVNEFFLAFLRAHSTPPLINSATRIHPGWPARVGFAAYPDVSYNWLGSKRESLQPR